MTFTVGQKYYYGWKTSAAFFVLLIYSFNDSVCCFCSLLFKHLKIGRCSECWDDEEPISAPYILFVFPFSPIVSLILVRHASVSIHHQSHDRPHWIHVSKHRHWRHQLNLPSAERKTLASTHLLFWGYTKLSECMAWFYLNFLGIIPLELHYLHLRPSVTDVNGCGYFAFSTHSSFQ